MKKIVCIICIFFCNNCLMAKNDIYYCNVYQAKKSTFIYTIDSIISNTDLSTIRALKSRKYFDCWYDPNPDFNNLINESTYKFIVLYGTTCAFINQYFLRYNNRYYVFLEKYPKLFGKLIYRRKFIDSHPIDFYVPIWRFYVRDNILYKYEFVAQESSIRGVDYSVNCKINLVD